MDIVQVATQEAALRSAWAPVAAFCAGIATCFGPCVAPRFVAITGLVGGARGAQRWSRILAFVGGLCMSYIAIGLAASLLGRVALWSSAIYVVMAVLLAVMGLRTILAPPSQTCANHLHEERSPASAGAALLLGASCAFVISPCCTPVVAALAGVSGAVGTLGFGVLLLGAFALGHAMPLVAVGTGTAAFERVLARHALATPVAIVSGALMLALAGYYALIA